MTDDALPRRKFLLGAGLAGTAIAAGISEQAEAQSQPAADAVAPAAPPAADSEPFVTLTTTEAAFIVAAVDTLIPADETLAIGQRLRRCDLHRPSARQCLGRRRKMYRSGPFHKGKPEQGYQLALTPREFFAAGIVASL
jgi:gluconate 2-dehydrogenase gamma chain